MESYDDFEEFFSHNLVPNCVGQMPVVSFVGRGIRGEQGIQGEQGPRGLRGNIGNPGPAGAGNTKIAFIKAETQDYDVMQTMTLGVGQEYDFPCDTISFFTPTAPARVYTPMTMAEFVSKYKPVGFLGLWPVRQFNTTDLEFIGIDEYIGNKKPVAINMKYRNKTTLSGVSYFGKSVIRGAVLLSADSVVNG